jgi:hypothetical protein
MKTQVYNKDYLHLPDVGTKRSVCLKGQYLGGSEQNIANSFISLVG